MNEQNTTTTGYLSLSAKKVTTATLQKMKDAGEKISMLTSYDFTLAKLVDSAGTDIILVGDSAANVMAGYDTTLPITLDQMIYHASCVRRAVRRAMVVADLPFGTYQADPLQAATSAVRMLKESGADAVKVEGGCEIEASIRKIVASGIPVMGHLGLTPQSVHKFGGYGLRAKEEAERQQLLSDAHLLQELGCFALVLEKIPADLAREVSESLHIPVIGIGAGPDVDGQVLVLHDMLGLSKGFEPKFLRKYADLGDRIEVALKQYCNDVKTQHFPSLAESY